MKRWLSIVIFIVLTGVLSGCSANSGIFHDKIVSPFTSLIHFTASLLGNNYGMAIIFITLLIRLVLAPFFIRMVKNQRETQQKMAALKPELEKIQKKIKVTKDQNEKQKYQKEMTDLYQKHGINPFNMGCLPIFIQMPILMGFYFAIRTSKVIASHHFLWFSLGQPDIVLALIACAAYFFQYLISQIYTAAKTQKSMRWVGLVSPLFILIISLNYPAALPLYWTVSGLFLAFQTFVGSKLYPSVQSSTA